MEERIKNRFHVRIATKRILQKEHFWTILGKYIKFLFENVDKKH